MELNQRPFKKLPGCRPRPFAALDARSGEAAAGHRDGAGAVQACAREHRLPRRLRGPLLLGAAPARRRGGGVASASTLEVLLRRQRIAAHVRSAKVGAFTTVAEHMPASHRAHLQWTPAKLISWGERIGAGHRRRGALADGAPCPPRAGLPLLPGPDAAGSRIRRRPPGGGLRPRAVHPRAALPQRQVDPGLRAGSARQQPAGRHRRAHASARQRTRPGYYRHH